MVDTVHLGQASALPASPEEARLDYVPNPRVGSLYLVRFAVPEFTSLCPVTGQPDFAHLVIDYAPGDTIVESKSLKLYLGSFRNHCGFHEDVTVGIGVPDEPVTLQLFGPPSIDEVDVPFTLSTASLSVTATVSWADDGVTDIDFELRAPDGTLTGAQGQSSANPEIATEAGPAGGWTVQIYPFLTLGTTVHVHVARARDGATCTTFGATSR